MATHTPSRGKAVPGQVLNLIDVSTKLAGSSSPSKTIRSSHKPDIILPRFTEWPQLSIEQKAKIFDMLTDYHEKSLGNPETDISQKTSAGFIATAELRKMSSELSGLLGEGLNVLREQTEDVLTFSFTLQVDKLSGFGRNSRDLAACIEYRLPHIYRNNAELHEHSRLYANAIAAVVLERANLTPFRRGYSTDLAKKFKDFALRPDAQYPYLVDPVALGGPSIVSDLPAPAATHRLVTTTPTPTAVNSPSVSQRNTTLQAGSSFWSGASELDYGSEEVQHALDMAEIAAYGRTTSVAPHPQVAETDDAESSAETLGSEEASTLDDSTSISESTLTDSTMTEPLYHQVSEHVFHSVGSQSQRQDQAHAFPYGMQTTLHSPAPALHVGENPPLHYRNPIAAFIPSMPVDAQAQPPSNIVVPTGYIVLQAPATPTHHRRSVAIGTPRTTRSVQQGHVESPTRGGPGPALSPLETQNEIRVPYSPVRREGKGKETGTRHRFSEGSSRGARK